MTALDYGIELDKLLSKMYNYQKQKIKCYITVTFFYGRQKEVIIERGTTKAVEQIDEFLDSDTPDKIRIELFKGEISEYVRIYPRKNSGDYDNQSQDGNFQGLGVADVNELVVQELNRIRHEEEFANLKERVVKLQKLLDEKEDECSDLEVEIQKLNKELQLKSTVEYYMGNAGSLLKGFGVPTEKLLKPFAGLMGVKDTPDESDEDTEEFDFSSPEEEASPKKEMPIYSFTQEQREELIQLIYEYLKQVNDQVLGEIFSIFSDIEKNNEIAKSIIQFINPN